MHPHTHTFSVLALFIVTHTPTRAHTHTHTLTHTHTHTLFHYVWHISPPTADYLAHLLPSSSLSVLSVSLSLSPFSLLSFRFFMPSTSLSKHPPTRMNTHQPLAHSNNYIVHTHWKRKRERKRERERERVSGCGCVCAVYLYTPLSLTHTHTHKHMYLRDRKTLAVGFSEHLLGSCSWSRVCVCVFIVLY